MNETKNMERRNIDRIKLFYYLQVYDRATHNCVGSVVDISALGMKLVSDASMSPETVGSFTILLPEGSILGDSIEIDARCKWSTQDHGSKSYESGFEFIKKADSGVFVVKALIEDLQKNNLL